MTTKNQMAPCDACIEPCKQPEGVVVVRCKGFKRRIADIQTLREEWGRLQSEVSDVVRRNPLAAATLGMRVVEEDGESHHAAGMRLAGELEADVNEFLTCGLQPMNPPTHQTPPTPRIP